MPFSPSDSQLFAPLFANTTLSAIFSDEQFICRLLEIEAALARVQDKLGIIPTGSGARITTAAKTLQVNLERLRAETEKDGFPIIELLKQLRAAVGGDTAHAVHWGATTQDIMDSALILQVRSALNVLTDSLQHVVRNLAALAAQHRTTLMAGRTHAQQALPMPFGLKVANWLAPLLRHGQRLAELKPRLLVVQFGGATGTLASLGARGDQVQAALADELGLALPLIPWHTQRDNLVELAGWLSLLSGSLAKMAQDVILLAQSEVGEVRETADLARGGSSTMPQKSNPIISELIIAAARSNAALLSALHHALVQEHERGTHGWQVEWLTLPQMFALTASALDKAAFLSQNLVVDVERMRVNVQASHGLMLAEALSLALSPHVGREAAKALVKDACQSALRENRHLADILREKTRAPLNWEALKDERAYFGASDIFIERVLRAANALSF